MRRMIIIFMLLFPCLIIATRYDVSLQKSGNYVKIQGTSYFLKITGYYEYSIKNAILDTITMTLYVEKTSYYGNQTQYDTYYCVQVYEEVDLPYGSLDDRGFSISKVFVPAKLN